MSKLRQKKLFGTWKRVVKWCTADYAGVDSTWKVAQRNAWPDPVSGEKYEIGARCCTPSSSPMSWNKSFNGLISHSTLAFSWARAGTISMGSFVGKTGLWGHGGTGNYISHRGWKEPLWKTSNRSQVTTPPLGVPRVPKVLHWPWGMRFGRGLRCFQNIFISKGASDTCQNLLVDWTLCTEYPQKW